jgi:hypothetical protein
MCGTCTYSNNEMIIAIYFKKKFSVFWDVAPCSHVEVDRISEASTASIIGAMNKAVRNSSSPWWWKQYAHLKRLSTLTWLYGATSQKTLNFQILLNRLEETGYIYELLVTSNKLTNNFANRVTNGLGPGVARRPQVNIGLHEEWTTFSTLNFINRDRKIVLVLCLTIYK